MRRRQFVRAVAGGVAAAVAGCGDDSRADKTAPPNERSRAAWVLGHDYTLPLALTAPGMDPRRRGIDWGRRSIGRTAGTGTDDGSVVYLGGQLYERQNPDADLDHAVTAVAAADGADRWRTEFDGDRFDSGVDGLVDADEGAVVGFDQEKTAGGGGFTGDTPGQIPELAGFDTDGELTYTVTAGDLAPEPGASFAAAASTVFVSNGGLDGNPAVAGYDAVTGERRFVDRPATVAATTETTAFLVRPAEADGLVARDGSDGTVRWERSVGRIYDLTVGPEQVYVLTRSAQGSRVHAFDRATGENRWTVRRDTGPGVGPVVLDDAVLVADTTVSVYGRDGTELGPVSEEARSPARAYDRVRANDKHVFLATRSDVSRPRTVALDRRTWQVLWTTDAVVPILGAANDSYYVISDTRRAAGRNEDGVDTRIRRAAGAEREPFDEFWVHGSPGSIDGTRVYTLLQTSDTALGGLYAYDLSGG